MWIVNCDDGGINAEIWGNLDKFEEFLRIFNDFNGEKSLTGD